MPNTLPYEVILADLRAKRDAMNVAIAALEQVAQGGAETLPEEALTQSATHPPARQRPRALRNYPTPALTDEYIANLDGDQMRAIALALKGASAETGIMSHEIEKLTGIKRQSIGQPLAIFRRDGVVRSEPTKPYRP